MSVGSAKRKKTAPLKSVEVKASRNSFKYFVGIHWRWGTESFTASSTHRYQSSGGVPVSASQPKGPNTTQLSVPTGEVSERCSDCWW